ncbi:MAG: amidohydrolase family protein [Kiritimatiellaeota bacterium]|nr:amidohydrolase family protein [Kiritimatiellota bacterium]
MQTPLYKAFFEKGRVADCPVYDMHGHLGPFYGSHLSHNDPASVVTAMKRAGVRLQVHCYHSALFTPDIGNAANIRTVREAPEYLRAYCGINPHYPDVIDEDLRTFENYPDVYVGLKFLADYHRIPLTDSRCRTAWEYADRKGLLVLLHTWGGSIYDGPEQVRECAKKYPGARILMGHSCYGEWDKGIALAKDFPNVYLELTAILFVRGIVEQFVAGAGSEKVLFGTDFPWFSHHYYIGGLLGSGIGDQACRNIFYRNAEKLLAPYIKLKRLTP